MNSQHEPRKTAKLIRQSGMALLTGAMVITGVPHGASHAHAEDSIYKPAPTSAYKLTKQDISHVYMTGKDMGGGHNNENHATRYAKIIPLTDENSAFEQEWMAVFNMGLHDDLYKQLLGYQGVSAININDHQQVKQLLENQNMPFTSNPWLNILVSKDLSIVGDFEFYVLEPMDKQYENKYMSSFDQLVKRVQNYREGDQIFRAKKTSKRSVETNESEIVELNKSEALTRFTNLRLEDADSEWTAWSTRFVTNDGVGVLSGENSFEFRNYQWSTDKTIENFYNPQGQDAYHNTNQSPSHFVLNDLGHGMRFSYQTQDSSKEGRIVVKFKTKRTPMDFFKDTKWNFLRRSNNTESDPKSTFVAAAYKSFDNNIVRAQMDVAVPKLALEDKDQDGLNDYYETLLGINDNSNNTDGDQNPDKQEYPSQLAVSLPAQNSGEYRPKEARLHAIKNLYLNPNTGQYAWQPQIDPAKSLGAFRMYGEDPAVGKVEFTPNQNDMEDGKLRYAVGSTISGKTAPYATVGLYPMVDQNNRELNVIAETVADKDGNFTLTLGYGLKRDQQNLNKWGNNILFADVDARTPQYDVWENENFKVIKANKPTAQIYVTSEGSDGRPAFLFPFYSTRAIQLSEPTTERPIEDRFREALANFKKVLVDNQKSLSPDEQNEIRDALKVDPVISGMLSPDSESYYAIDDGSGYVYNIPLKGKDLKIPVTELTEERRKLANGSIDQVYDDDSAFTMTLPQPQNENSKLKAGDKYVISVLDGTSNQPKGEKTEVVLTDDMLRGTKLEDNIGIEVVKGDKLVVEFKDAQDRPLTKLENTVAHRESSAELKEPSQTWSQNDGFKLVFKIPDSVTDPESAFLTDANGDPIMNGDQKITGTIDKDKKTVTFDLANVEDKKVVRASFTEANKKPSVSSDSHSVDKREIGAVSFAEDPAKDATKVSIKKPDNIQEGDSIVVSIKPAGSQENTPAEEKGTLSYTASDAATIDIPLSNGYTLNEGDKIVVTVKAKNGHSKSSNEFEVPTVTTPVDDAAVTQEPSLDPVNETQPAIKIGNIDPHANKITITAGTNPNTETLELTKTDQGWTLSDGDKNKYDLSTEGQEPNTKLVLTPKPNQKTALEGKDIIAKVTNTNDPAHTEKPSNTVKYDTTKPSAPKIEPVYVDAQEVKIELPADALDGDKVKLSITPAGNTGDGSTTPVQKELTISSTNKKEENGKTYVTISLDAPLKKGDSVKALIEDAAGNVSDPATATVDDKPLPPQKDADKHKPNPPKKKVEVDNLNQLTPEEQKAVKKAVEDANKDEQGKSTIPENSKIEVNDKGAVTITYPDQSTNTISSDKTVVEKLNPNKIKEGDTEIKVKEPTDANEIEVKLPTDPETVVTINKDKGTGEWTTGDGTTVNKDEQGNLVIPLPEGTKVPTPSDGKDKVTITTKKDGEEQNKTEVPIIKLTDAERVTPVTPGNKVEVADPNNLTEDEKKAVEDAIREANKKGDGTSILPDGTKIEIAANGDATITYPDKTSDSISGEDLVKEKKQPEKPEVDKSGLKDLIDKGDGLLNDDKYKNADPDKKKDFDDALEEAKKTFNDPNSTQEQIDAAKKKLQDAIDALNGKNSDNSGTDNTGGSGTPDASYIGKLLADLDSKADQANKANQAKKASHYGAKIPKTADSSQAGLAAAMMAAGAAMLAFAKRGFRREKQD